MKLSKIAEKPGRYILWKESKSVFIHTCHIYGDPF